MEQIKKIMDELSEVEKEKQIIQAQEKELKNELVDLMKNLKISTLENVFIKVNLIGRFTRKTVDSDKLRKQFPEAAKACTKSTVIEPFVKVTVMG